MKNTPAKQVPVTLPAETVEPKQSGDVVIITDCEADNVQLQQMIARFQAKLAIQSRVVNIREYPIKGGCLGCFNCAVSGKCIYTDGFDEFLRNQIQTADPIFMELLPLSLEEIFISETEVVGYDIKKLIFS